MSLKTLVLISVFFTPLLSFGQVDTFYFNRNWKITVKDSASYYRLASKQKDGLYKVEDHYINGNLQMTGQCSNPGADEGKTGRFIYYDSSGKISEEGTFENNLSTGSDKRYYKGYLIDEKMFKDNLLNGPSVFYDSFTHKKQCEGGYINDKKNGLWTFYDVKTGVKFATQNYETDLREGEFVLFDSLGKKIEERWYKRGIGSGKWKYYYEENLTCEVMYENNFPNGHVVTYDSFTHNKRSEGELVNGKRNGLWIFYDKETRAIITKESYEMGIAEGAGIFFDKEGKLEAEVSKKRGVQDGWCKFYRKGELHHEMMYKDGMPNGKAVYYDSITHTKKSDGIFENGKRTGEWRFYDLKDGSVTSTETYSQGSLDGTCIEYEKGIKYSEGKYVRGKRTGSWKYYFNDGKIEHEENYDVTGFNKKLIYYDSMTHKIIAAGSMKDENRDGPWKYYYNNGEKKFEENYKEGVLDGPFEAYDTIGYKVLEALFLNDMRSGSWKFYYEHSKVLWAEMNFAEDSLSGEIKTYYRDGKAKRKELYQNSKKVSGACYEPNGSETTCYPFLTKASFKGDVMEYIGKKLVYPEKAKEAGIEGKVVVGFYVNADGTISDINVVKGIGYGCDEEAKRIVAEMPNWLPEQIDGRTIQTYYTLPIVFWIH